MITPNIEESWKKVLWDEFQQPYFAELKQFLLEEKRKYTVYPPGPMIYHEPGQAHGLCFSVQDGVPHPKSLINIFKELHDDVGFEIPVNGNLEKWTEQGVFLLNATLTVRAHAAGSHQNHGWERFTDAAISKLSLLREGLVFLLWGNYAKQKEALIDTSKHYILSTVHPSPLSAHRGFFGCKHFSKTNELLRQMGKSEINWQL